MKVIYIDTETTGLDPQKNEIVQIAAIYEVNGLVFDSINIRCRPTVETIDEEVLKILGKTKKEVFEQPDPKVTAKTFGMWLESKFNKFDKSSRPFVVGHNIGFDIDFLNAFFKRHVDKYGFMSYVGGTMDTMQLASIMKFNGMISKTQDMKLGTLCEKFNISLKAHDAMEDITATRSLFLTLNDLLIANRNVRGK
jgi:DNA polymerase-3 subunit epsilon